MKRLLMLIVAVLFGVAPLAAQAPVLAYGTAVASSPRLNATQSLCQAGTGLPINDHTFVFHAFGGPSALLVTATGSTGGAQSSLATSTSTSGGTIHFTGAYNTVCLTLTSITGANAYIDAAYQGVNAAASASGSVTVTGDVTVVQPTGTNLHVVVDSGGGGVTYTQDAALTVATTSMIMAGGRASAAAPTGVSADDDAVIPWFLRSGAAAVQPTYGGILAVAGNGASGTGVQRVTIANDSTGVVALAASSAVIGHVIVDSGGGSGVTDADDGSVAAAQTVQLVINENYVFGGSTWARQTFGAAGSASTQVTTIQGIASMTPLSVTSTTVDSAEGAAVGTTPVPVGCVYRTTFTTLDAGDVGYIACDVNGRLVHAPAPGPLVNGVTSSMTGTTSTSVVSGTASNYLYITSCRFTNTDADTDTAMLLQDGSGGTTLDIVPVPHLTGGAVVTYPTPLKVPTSGNALYTANATTGATTYASCSGFRSTASF